jgi:beta-galactosidase
MGERPGEHYVTGGQPDWHGAYCGDVDITGWRKPISHYRDILWNDHGDMQPYMAVKEPDGYNGKIRETQWSVWPTWESWNWPGWEGKPIEVEVYTKQPYVVLYRDDVLIGKEKVSRETGYKAVFTLDYMPGSLEAITDNGGAVLVTSDAPARLRLTPDRTAISADGQDLAFITLEVVDREGELVPDAAIPCQVTVGGQGSLLAAASANLQDLEPTTSANVTTWKGRALIVVRSAQKRGSVSISVSSSLPTARATVKTR